MRRLLLLISLIVLLTACGTVRSFRDLAIDRYQGEQFGMVVAEVSAGSGQAPLLILLFREQAGLPELMEVRIGEPGKPAIFVARDEGLRLVAFEDVDGDFRYQPGEPVAVVSPHWTRRSDATPDPLNPHHYPRTLLQLQADLSTDQRAWRSHLTELDASVQGLQERFMTVVSLDDARFDEQAMRLGQWQPLKFTQTIGYGLYLLEPWQPGKQPVLFVHGINDTPRTWQPLLEQLDRSRFQPLLYYYPGSMPLEYSAYLLTEAVTALCVREGGLTLPVVAHSMGGLVARRYLQMVSQRRCAPQSPWLVTLSTPWAGHRGAQLAVEKSPIIAPVWRDMAPGSDFLGKLVSRPLPSGTAHHLLATDGNGKLIMGEPNDGVVTLASQLLPEIRVSAASVTEVHVGHMAIIRDEQTVALLTRLLAAGSR